MATVSPAWSTRPTPSVATSARMPPTGATIRRSSPSCWSRSTVAAPVPHLGTQAGGLALQTLDLDLVLGVFVLLLGVDARAGQAERFGGGTRLFRRRLRADQVGLPDQSVGCELGHPRLVVGRKVRRGAAAS